MIPTSDPFSERVAPPAQRSTTVLCLPPLGARSVLTENSRCRDNSRENYRLRPITRQALKESHLLLLLSSRGAKQRALNTLETDQYRRVGIYTNINCQTQPVRLSATDARCCATLSRERYAAGAVQPNLLQQYLLCVCVCMIRDPSAKRQ